MSPAVTFPEENKWKKIIGVQRLFHVQPCVEKARGRRISNRLTTPFIKTKFWQQTLLERITEWMERERQVTAACLLINITSAAFQFTSVKNKGEAACQEDVLWLQRVSWGGCRRAAGNGANKEPVQFPRHSGQENHSGSFQGRRFCFVSQ